MARELTAAELAKLRTHGQRSILYLAILTPDVVLERRVDGAPSSDDKVVQITYDDPDGGTGVHGDVEAGMTLLVGSSTGEYGDYDLGVARIRKAPTADTIYIGETSEIEWEDNALLQVVREFLIWPRHNYVDPSTNVNYMDYDVAFDDPTHNPHAYPAPVPIIGPHAAVWLGSGDTATIRFDASDSYTVGGAGAMTYAWTVIPSGTASFDDAGSATPILTVTAADTYTVKCVITWTYTAGSRAVSSTTYRHVFAFDDDNPPTTVFQLRNCVGSANAGGWQFSVTLWDEALRSEIRDQALAVLFAKDWHGRKDTDLDSIGPLIVGANPIRENVIAIGRIATESIAWNAEQGTVDLTVYGPHHWLKNMEGFPSGYEDVDGTPDAWTNVEDLTPRKAAGLWWLWRTTGSLAMDAFLFPDSVIAAGASPSALSEGEERQIAVFDAPPGKLWQQFEQAIYIAVRARFLCDRYGRGFLQRDLNEILVADRTAANAPTVMTLTTQDWRDSIDIERVTYPPCALLDMSGVYYKDGTKGTAFSLAPGHVFRRFGSIDRVERLALWQSSYQTNANNLCGLLFGRMNNEYPVISVPLAGNYRVFDIAPWQYAAMSVVAGDTERGIAESWDLIPRRVSFVHTPQTGVLSADVEFEASTSPSSAVDGDPPPTPPDPPDPPAPPAPSDPPTPPGSEGVVIMCEDQIAVSFDFFDEASPSWSDLVTGDLSGAGDFQSIVVYGLKAYLTTRINPYASDADMENCGLWYCADISADSPSWTLVKSAYQAAVDSGYRYYSEAAPALDTCCFGALAVADDGTVGALIHSIGNRPPPDAPGSIIYTGSETSFSAQQLGTYPGQGYFFQQQPWDSAVHSVYYYEADGDWYVAGIADGLGAAVAYGPGDFVDFSGVTTPKTNCCSSEAGYVIGHNAGKVWTGWDPGSQLGALTLQKTTGIWRYSSSYYYLEDDGAYDLYVDSGGSPIGDASAEFGAGRYGSMVDFGSSGELLWVCGNDAHQVSSHKVVLMSDDNGASWVNKTGDFYTEIGVSWTGWTSASLANSIVRQFTT